MRIQHNIAALNSYRNLTTNNSAVSKNLEKLSSGYRINRAGDDAAGLAISEKMRAQITGLKTAQKNANDGISLVQTAEGAMTEIHSMLNRMVELADQSANGTYADEVDRENLQKEIASLKDEINRIADSTNFNGINLLDGSLDADSTANIDDASAISNITTGEYSDKGVSAAFEAKYITNRPPAATVQTNASFQVKFDDVALGASTNGNNTYSVTIGDKQINIDSGATTALSGSDIAAAIATSGNRIGTAKEQTNNAAKVTDAETSKWDNGAAAGANDAVSKYVKIDGHWWSMAANDDTVTFTQVDYSESKGEVINPDYSVSFNKTGGGEFTGTTNWKVQNPGRGEAVGASHQAQVSVGIDFSKLKDGDTLTAGEYTYVFKVGANGTATAADGGTNGVLVDLSTIFKTESDLADANKQADAMVKIAGDMAKGKGGTTPSTTWSIGNGGVDNGVGTLTFQSLSTYADDTTGTNIGGNTNNDTCNMSTEADVMKQFVSSSKGNAANVSFDLDVTKLKDGDTITIDGTTFEFTDGSVPSGKGNVAVDLKDLGISNGLLSSQTGDVMAKLQTAINANLNYGYASGSTTLVTKYDVTVDGSKMTLTSKDNAATNAVYEDRTVAKIELPQSAYAGKALMLQIGDTADDFNQLNVSVKDMHTKAMGIADINISTQSDAAKAVDAIKSAINYVSSTRGDLGAIQNRLEHTINNLSVTTENMTAAESRIRDVDMAEEMMAYTKNNILVQASQAMLAQANQIPQGVLQLLQ